MIPVHRTHGSGVIHAARKVTPYPTPFPTYRTLCGAHEGLLGYDFQSDSANGGKPVTCGRCLSSTSYQDRSPASEPDMLEPSDYGEPGL